VKTGSGHNGAALRDPSLPRRRTQPLRLDQPSPPRNVHHHAV